jgi:hypothetical protein
MASEARVVGWFETGGHPAGGIGDEDAPVGLLETD